MTVVATTQVTVRFFASLREAVGAESMTLEVEEATLAGVRTMLATRLAAQQFDALAAEGLQVAVNQVIVAGEAALEAGDEIAFLPPVTGG